MKKKALKKDFYTEIRKSLNRFLSIFFIVTMGVAFFSGIQASAPDMRATGDAYFDGSNLMDVKVLCTLGLTEDDLETLRQVEGVEQVRGAYMEDVFCGEEDAQEVLHIESITEGINDLTADAGRLPQKEGECFLDSEYAKKQGYEPGDRIEVMVADEENTFLRRTSFTVSGYGSSPCYIAFERGSTSLGSGSVSAFMYVLQEEFDSEVYSVAYLQAAGAKEEMAYSEGYDRLVGDVMDRVEALEDVRCEIRYDEVTEEAREKLEDAKQEVEDGKQELEDARQELEDGRKEAESELSEAESELTEGESELAEGKQELEDAKKEVADGEQELLDGEAEIAENEEKLADGRAQLEEGREKLQSGEAEYQSGMQEYRKQSASAEKKLNSAQKQINQGKKQLEAGWEEYRTQVKKLEEGEAQLDQAEKQLTQSQKEYDEGAKQLAAGKDELEAQAAKLQEGQAQYEAGKAGLQEGQAQYESGKARLDDAWQQYQEGAEALAQGQQEYKTAAAQVKAAQDSYEEGTQGISFLYSQADGLDGTAAELQSRKEAWEQELPGKQEALSQAEASLNQAKQVYEEAEAVRQAAQGEWQQAETSWQQAESLHQEAEDAWQSAKNDWDGAEAAAQEAEGACKAAQAALQNAEQEYQSAQTALQNAEQEYQSAQSALQEAERRWKELEDGEGSEEEIEKAKEKVNSCKAAAEAKESARDSARKDAEGKAAAVENQRSDAESKKAAAESLRSAVDGKKAAAESKRAAADEKKAAADSLRSAADGKKAAADSAQAAAESARQDMDSAGTVKNGCQAAVEQLSGGIAGLSSSIAEAQGQAAALRQQARELEQSLPAQKEAIDQAAGELAATKAVLEEKEAVLAATKAELEKQDRALTAAKAELEENSALLAGTKAQLDQGAAALEAGRRELEENEAKLDEAAAQLSAGWEQLSQGRTETAEGKKKLAKAKKTLEANEKKLKSSQKQVEEGKKELGSAKKKLTSARKELDTGWAELNVSQSQLADGERQLSDARTQLSDARKEIADAKKEIADAEKEIAENEQKIKDGWADYEDGKREAQDKIREGEQKIADAEQELLDAEQEIADAEQKLADLRYPKWYVYDRNSLPENTGFGENADRLSNIAKVFPVLFFLVAALISLTTMTRMVEEERTQIGTMKALGYGKKDIASKYLKYAFLATLGGSVVGVLVGEKIFPWIIINAYGIMYIHLPEILIPYDWGFGIMATAVALVCTIGATLSACYRELQAVPAQLMRPPTPKEGKRVWLEYLPFIWKRLSFTWKSTVRNLMRYKKRFLMTVIGIGGCMGLLLVGYGLRDSIMDVAVLQFEELQLYDALVVLDTDGPEEEQQEVLACLDQDSRITSGKRFYMQKSELHGDAERGNKKDWSVYLYVPENTEALDELLTFRSRTKDETYTLTDEGAIVSEKIAKEFHVEPGDTIPLNFEEETVEVPVTAVCENYLHHFIYMTPGLYEKLYGEAPEYNSYFIRTEDGLDDAKEIGREVLTQDVVLNVTYTKSMKEQLDYMLGALDAVIIVLIVSAGMLAFVVLYNLNNININERKRELATIKVLGFYDGEVASYVYRENVLLTIIGAFVGIFMGKFLHAFIITTVEVDTCMFGRNIKTGSYIIGTLFTFGFSIIVNFVMYFKLKKIDMVESLKSVE